MELEGLQARLGGSHYDVLGVPPDAPTQVIQNAFFGLAKKWHPDRLKSELSDLKDTATRVFARLSEASQVLSDPEKRRAIVAFVKATAEASRALKKNPKPYWPHISSVIGFSEEEISWGWPETEFPIHIIPDMLDVLEVEEQWVARERNRTPRTRAELAKLIDRSVVEEALKR